MNPIGDLGSEENSKFDIEKYLLKYRLVLVVLLGGLGLIGAGIFFWKGGSFKSQADVEVVETSEEVSEKELLIEVSGEVNKPGVYKMASGARVDDALVTAGGLNGKANKVWVEKTINRAAKLSDGQKIYIPAIDEQTNVLSAKSDVGDQTASSGSTAENGDFVNINSASTSELDTLPGIGPVYAQNIIEHRPYSSVEELLTKDVLKKSTYEKIKDLIAAY